MRHVASGPQDAPKPTGPWPVRSTARRSRGALVVRPGGDLENYIQNSASLQECSVLKPTIHLLDHIAAINVRHHRRQCPFFMNVYLVGKINETIWVWALVHSMTAADPVTSSKIDLP